MPTLTPAAPAPTIDHCEGMSDEAILARRRCDCEQGGLYARVYPGHCAACQRCGAPGHACHYPGPIALSGSWCDDHYLEEARYRPMLRLRRG